MELQSSQSRGHDCGIVANYPGKLRELWSAVLLTEILRMRIP